MKVFCIFLIAAVTSVKFRFTLGTPLTKWFKTDNNIYYIEENQKFTWQQSYEECEKKNMALVTAKAYKEDELLLQYIQNSFDPKPEFWLKANTNVDLKNINELLGSVMAANFLDIKWNGVNDMEIIQPNNPDNCALTADGTVEACQTVHGYICHDATTKANRGQNVQNIVLRFN